MRKILTSLSIIAFAAVMAISATMAYFQDTETSSGNTLSAGTLDLLIADTAPVGSETFRNGVTATWTATDMKPGDKEAFQVNKVELMKKFGGIEASHTEITCDYQVKDTCDPLNFAYLESDTNCQTNLPPGPDKMAKEMLITRCVYHDIICIDCLTGIKHVGYDGENGVCVGANLGQNDDWKIEDKNSDGKISFYDLKNDKLDNLPAVPNTPPFSFRMSVKFDENAGNDFQGDIFDLTMIFKLNQDASQ